MPDWGKIVHERLADLAWEDDDRSQVFEEVAGHIEENYQCLLDNGCSEEEAVRRTLADVGNWQVFLKKIELSRKKEFSVPKRVTQFWIPALLTFFCSMVLLMVIQFFGPAHHNRLQQQAPHNSYRRCLSFVAGHVAVGWGRGSISFDSRWREPSRGIHVHYFSDFALSGVFSGCPSGGADS